MVVVVTDIGGVVIGEDIADAEDGAAGDIAGERPACGVAAGLEPSGTTSGPSGLRGRCNGADRCP